MAGGPLRVLSVGLDIPDEAADRPVPNRQVHLYEHLGVDAVVTAVGFAPEGRHGPLPAVFAGAVVLPGRPVRPGVATRVANRAAFVLGGPPPYVRHHVGAERSGPGVAEALARLMGEGSYDVVVFEEEAARWLPFPDPGPVPVTCHRLQLFGEALAQQGRTTPWGRLEGKVERAAWRRYDRQAVSGLAMAFPSSPSIATGLARLAPGVPMTVVLNGANLDRPPLRPSSGTDVVTIGSMDADPNIDGAVWLAERVWPTVAAAVPEARLRIVGRNPAPAVLRLAGPRVTVTGEVDDVGAACAGARVGAVPVRIGLGIKTKTIHTMALGLPVVSTSLGADAIEGGPEQGLVIADDPAAFADAVIRLLRRPADADRIGSAGRRHLEDHYSWSAAGRCYGQALAGVAAGRPR